MKQQIHLNKNIFDRFSRKGMGRESVKQEAVGGLWFAVYCLLLRAIVKILLYDTSCPPAE